MSSTPRILAFAGSARQESYNKRLIALAARGAEQAGAAVTLLDLRDFPLPLFDEDLEKAGPPEHLARLHAHFMDAQGILISSPEYNSSITPLTKNTIDWISRANFGHAGLAAFKGKAAGLVSASPGGLGGLRGLVHLRSILGNIGVLVIPEQVAVARAFETFNPDGSLKDAKQQESVENVGKSLATLLAKLS